MKSPNPSFLYSLTRPYFSIVKHSALNTDLISWKKWPIGAGYYAVSDEDDSKVVLLAKSGFKNTPKIIEVYKRSVPGLVFDVSFEKDSRLSGVYKSTDPSAIYTMFFTNQNVLSANGNFRLAVSYGVNRAELASLAEFSKPAHEFLPSSFWRNKEIGHAFDLEKARQYFERVPSKLRHKRWRIPVFAFGNFSSEQKRVYTALKKQFKAFGFEAEFYASTEKFLKKETATASPISVAGRICNNIDPLLMFSSFKTNSAFKYDNAQNDSNYDKLFETAANAVGTEARVSTLRSLSKYTIDHNFMVPIYESLQVFYYNENTVADFGNQPNALTLFISNCFKR